MKRITKIIALSAALISIQVAIPTAQAAEDKKEEVNLEGNFIRGAKLWANRCASCHNMRDPKDLSDSEWKAAVTHMRVRAGLSGQDSRDILKFLQKSN